MNHLIVEIINKISLLPEPLSFEQITVFFSQSTAFQQLRTSLDFQRGYPELLALYQTATQGLRKKQKLDALQIEYDDLLAVQQDLHALQKEEQKLDNTLKTINKRIKETRNELTQTCNKFAKMILQSKEYETFITRTASLMNSPSELTKTQYLFMQKYKGKIEHEETELMRPLGQKKLVQLKEQKQSLITQLNDCLIRYHCDKYDPTIPFDTQNKVIRQKIARDLSIINQYEPKIDVLQQKFATYLSMEEGEKVLQEEEANLIQKQKDITDALNSFSAINEQIKSNISRSRQNKSLEELLLNEEQKENTIFAYLNPFTAIDLYQEPEKHKEEQRVTRHTREYLELLLKQKRVQNTLNELKNRQEEFRKVSLIAKKNNAEQTNLQSQLTLFNKIASSTLHEVSSEERKLMDETISLINQLPLPQSSDGFCAATSSFNDHYIKCLLTNIAFITEQKNTFKTIEQLLTQLNNILVELADVRTKYDLSEPLDTSLPPKAELDKIDDEHLTTTINLLSEKQNIYLQCIEQLELLYVQIQQYNAEEKQIKMQKERCQFDAKVCTLTLHEKALNTIDEQKKALETELSEELNHLEQQKKDIENKNYDSLSNHNQELRSLINVQPSSSEFSQLLNYSPIHESLTIERELENTQPEESISTLSLLLPTTPLAIEEHEYLTRTPTNTSINTLVVSDTSSISSEQFSPFTNNSHANNRTDDKFIAVEQMNLWHQDILHAMTSKPEEIKNWYIAVHQQAINSPKESDAFYKYFYLLKDIHFEIDTKDELDVLLSYQRITPKPDEDCSALLSSKPHYPLEDIHSFNHDVLKALPQALQNIYAHYKKLQNTHNIEAQLLRHIFLSLATIYNDDKPGKKIPALLDDARYTPLKRHRGLLKIWELIEDCFNMIIGNITGKMAHEYTKQPSFFKTTSTRLIEEAQICVASSCPG